MDFFPYPVFILLPSPKEDASYWGGGQNILPPCCSSVLAQCLENHRSMRNLFLITLRSGQEK